MGKISVLKLLERLMQEMYTMSIDIHNFGVMALILVMIINVVLLKLNSDIRVYAKKMRIFMPISTSLIFLIIFTGTVMMAAKHLNFTVQNIIMILFAIVLILMEVYRYKRLKQSIVEEFDKYKIASYKILGVELVMTFMIALWMFSISNNWGS